MHVHSKTYSFSVVETPAKVAENVEQRNRLESVEDNLPKVVIPPIKAFPDKQVYSLQKIIMKVPRLCSNRLKGFWAFDRLSQITLTDKLLYPKMADTVVPGFSVLGFRALP